MAATVGEARRKLRCCGVINVPCRRSPLAPMADDEYLADHTPAIEPQKAGAISAALRDRSHCPLRFISSHPVCRGDFLVSLTTATQMPLCLPQDNLTFGSETTDLAGPEQTSSREAELEAKAAHLNAANTAALRAANAGAECLRSPPPSGRMGGGGRRQAHTRAGARSGVARCDWHRQPAAHRTCVRHRQLPGAPLRLAVHAIVHRAAREEVHG